MKEKKLQIGLYIVSTLSILTGIATISTAGSITLVSGIVGIVLTVLLSKRTKELNKTINDKDYEIQHLNDDVSSKTNAVALEGALHDRLDAQRVNKVNRRKEFFYSSVDELEAIVNEIDPTAEFNKTMMATEFRQSQSSDETYTDDYNGDIDIEDDDD